MIERLSQYLHKRRFQPAAAYDLWSATYDQQPGNLIIDLDEQIFHELIANVGVQNKVLVDVGCGTGRHWHKLYALGPQQLVGFDVSAGMLNKLRAKHATALTCQLNDHRLPGFPDAYTDCLVSTLTIAHISDPAAAITEWCRVVKGGGDIIVTDYHPEMLAHGADRSFGHNGRTVSVVNYVHPLDRLEKIFADNHCTILRRCERRIDESVRHYYEAKNAGHVYERFRGMPVIYGWHIKKEA